MGCVGTGLKKYAIQLGYPNLSSIGIGIPVSLRPPPASLEDELTFQNSLGLGLVEFPIYEDLQTTIKEGRQKLHAKISVLVMWGSQQIQKILKYNKVYLNNLT